MNLSKPTPIDDETFDFMRQIVVQRRKLAGGANVRNFNLPPNIQRQYEMVCCRIKDRLKSVTASITEGERLEVANLGEYLVETFHSLRGTPDDQVPARECYAQTTV